MKYFKILLISLMLIGSFPVTLITTSQTATAQTTYDGWEFIGQTSAFNPSYGYYEGSLYVKAVGYTLMYRFKGYDNKIYSVVKNTNRSDYNASIKSGDLTYYLNVPQW